MYLSFEFYYAAIKTTERQTEKIEELLGDLFDPEESKVMKREMSCKDIIYHECNDHDECNNYDKYDEQWSMIMNWLMYLKHNDSNKSNEKWWLLPLMMSSDADDVLIWAI